MKAVGRRRAGPDGRGRPGRRVRPRGAAGRAVGEDRRRPGPPVGRPGRRADPVHGRRPDGPLPDGRGPGRRPAAARHGPAAAGRAEPELGRAVAEVAQAPAARPAPRAGPGRRAGGRRRARRPGGPAGGPGAGGPAGRAGAPRARPLPRGGRGGPDRRGAARRASRSPGRSAASLPTLTGPPTGPQAAADLHAVCEQVRPLYAADVLPADQARTALEHCRQVWAARADIADRLADQPTPELEARWRGDLLDLGILTAYLEARAGETPDRALATLTEAEELLGPSGVLYLERARNLRASGQPAAADAAERRAAELPAADGLGVPGRRPGPAGGRRPGRGGRGPRPLPGLGPAVGVGKLLPRGVRPEARISRPRRWPPSPPAWRSTPRAPGACTTAGWPSRPPGATDRAAADLDRALARDPSIAPARDLRNRLRGN